MSANDWMGSRTESNVQTAIDSQTIQTTLEQNTSSLSPTAFNSFLQNAPIPRFYVTTPTNTFTGGGATSTPVWAVTTYFDPYKMLVPSTGIITVPMDGFYEFTFTLSGSGTASSTMIIWFICAGLATGHGSSPGSGLTGTIYNDTAVVVIPLRQGNTVKPQASVSGAADLSSVTAQLGGVWCAPYNQYQTGAGGN